ncbi:MAG: thioredoxin family protein [Thermoplasmata archaeon]
MSEKTDESKVTIEFIYSDTCPDCPPAKELVERIIPEFEDVDVNVDVKYLEARDSTQFIEKYDITHVPTVVINEEVVFVESLTEAKLRTKLQELIDG